MGGSNLSGNGILASHCDGGNEFIGIIKKYHSKKNTFQWLNVPCPLIFNIHTTSKVTLEQGLTFGVETVVLKDFTFARWIVQLRSVPSSPSGSEACAGLPHSPDKPYWVAWELLRFIAWKPEWLRNILEGRVHAPWSLNQPSLILVSPHTPLPQTPLSIPIASFTRWPGSLAPNLERSQLPPSKAGITHAHMPAPEVSTWVE